MHNYLNTILNVIHYMLWMVFLITELYEIFKEQKFIGVLRAICFFYIKYLYIRRLVVLSSPPCLPTRQAEFDHARDSILISFLELGTCPLCCVLCCLWHSAIVYFYCYGG